MKDLFEQVVIKRHGSIEIDYGEHSEIVIPCRFKIRGKDYGLVHHVDGSEFAYAKFDVIQCVCEEILRKIKMADKEEV